jgi:hypothetical protein
LISSLDVLFGENRLTCCYAPNEWQTNLLAQRIFESNAARHARQKLDYALALERTQMLLGRIDRAKLQRLGYFRTRGRHARFVHSLLNQQQNLPLPRSEIAHDRLPVYKISLTLYTARPRDESSERYPPQKVQSQSLRFECCTSKVHSHCLQMTTYTTEGV